MYPLSLFFVAIFVVLLSLGYETHAVPLSYTLVDPKNAIGYGTRRHREDVRRVHNAVKDAHSQIENMAKVMEHPDLPDHRKILRKAFGDNANIDAIKANVERLRTGVIEVKHVRKTYTDPKIEGAWHHETGHVSFGHAFHHKGTPDERAAVVIHEASHALNRAVDHFSNDPSTEAVSGAQKKNHPNSLVGYHMDDFNTLKQMGSKNLHRNADSYMLFGHLATNGLHTLTDEKRLHYKSSDFSIPTSGSTTTKHLEGHNGQVSFGTQTSHLTGYSTGNNHGPPAPAAVPHGAKRLTNKQIMKGELNNPYPTPMDKPGAWPAVPKGHHTDLHVDGTYPHNMLAAGEVAKDARRGRPQHRIQHAVGGSSKRRKSRSRSKSKSRSQRRKNKKEPHGTPAQHASTSQQHHHDAHTPAPPPQPQDHREASKIRNKLKKKRH